MTDPHGRSGHVPAHAAALRSRVDLAHIRPLRVVVDLRHEADDSIVRAVLGTDGGLAPLPLDLVVLHAGAGATPVPPRSDDDAGEDLADLQAVVLEHSADVGLVLDAAQGRCVVVDERGVAVGPSTLVALVALREIARDRADGREPVVVHDLLTSRAVTDLAESAGATVVRTPAGRVAVKAERVRCDAVLGGDHTGFVTFRGVPDRDAGLVAAMHVLAVLGGQTHPLSDLGELYEPYVSSGEISLGGTDLGAALMRVRRAYVTDQGAGPVDADDLDGLTVSHWGSTPRWWFTLRAAHGPGDVRLVVEAADEDIMTKVRDDVLALARNDGETFG